MVGPFIENKDSVDMSGVLPCAAGTYKINLKFMSTRFNVGPVVLPWDLTRFKGSGINKFGHRFI